MKLSDAERALIRDVPLFSGLTEERLRWLIERAHAAELPEGSTLFVQDEPADRFFVLLDGWVKLARLSEDGNEAVVNVVAPGETFAEAAMFAQGLFPVCAESVSKVRVLSFSAQIFVDIVASHGDVALAMLGSLSLRLRQLVRQIEQLQVKSAPQRVADFLVRLCPPGGKPCAFPLPLNKALIARRLGMRPETFSRALARLRDLGVDQKDGRIVIADVRALRAFAEETPQPGEGLTCR